MKTKENDLKLREFVLDYLIEHKFASPDVLFMPVKNFIWAEIEELLESVELPAFTSYVNQVFESEYNVALEIEHILYETFAGYPYTIVVTREKPNREKYSIFECMCDDLEVLQNEVESTQEKYISQPNVSITTWKYNKENFSLEEIEVK